MSEPDRVIFLASLGASSPPAAEQREAVRRSLEACAPLPFTWSAHDSWAAHCGRQEWLMVSVDGDWGTGRVSTLTLDASFVRCVGAHAAARFLTDVAAAWHAEEGATSRSFEDVAMPGEWPPPRLRWFHYFGRERAAGWPDSVWADPTLYMTVRTASGGVGMCVGPDPFDDESAIDERAGLAARVLGLPHGSRW
jgi:hypothetical protein